MQTIFIGGEFLAQNLDRDLASELHVLGEINLTHSARTELLKYSIMRDLIGFHLCLVWLKTPKRSTQQCSRHCLLKQPQDQNRNERRNINPTQRRDRSSQWSQQRLRDVNQKTHDTVRVADHSPREDNAKGNEQNVNRN